MTDDGIIELAAAEGLELEERVCQDAWVWDWCRGDDQRWPCDLGRRQAIGWMRDRLRRRPPY